MSRKLENAFFFTVLLLSLAWESQGQTANCTITASLTTPGTVVFDNRTNQCTVWVVSYYANGFTALSFEFDFASDIGGAPSTSWTPLTPTVGQNPSTSTNFGYASYSSNNYPWIRLNLVSVSGTGSLNSKAYGVANTHMDSRLRYGHLFANTGHWLFGSTTAGTQTDDGVHEVQIAGGLSSTQQSVLGGYNVNGPLDPTSISIDEEFWPSSNGEGITGQYGWASHVLTGGSCTITPTTGNYPNLGVLYVASDTVSTHGCNLALDYGSPNTFPTLQSTWAWYSEWIFASVTATTSQQLRVGFVPSGNTTNIPASGYYLRYDTTLGTPDTNFMLCVNSSSTEVCANTGIPADTSYHRVKIYWVNSSTIGMSFYNAGALQSSATFCPSGCTVSATPTTVALVPSAMIATATTAARAIQLDLFAFQVTEVSNR